MIRHFTATGFVVHEGCVALHWHPKVGAWLPPGGHIEQNEDPVEAVLREVLEETDIEVEVVSDPTPLGLDYPEEVSPPYTIMVEDIQDPVDGFHHHIDMIYFCRPVEASPVLADGWQWVSRAELEGREPLSGYSGRVEPPPEDVRRLGMRAIDYVGD